MFADVVLGILREQADGRFCDEQVHETADLFREFSLMDVIAGLRQAFEFSSDQEEIVILAIDIVRQRIDLHEHLIGDVIRLLDHGSRIVRHAAIQAIAATGAVGLTAIPRLTSIARTDEYALGLYAIESIAQLDMRRLKDLLPVLNAKANAGFSGDRDLARELLSRYRRFLRNSL